MGRERRSEERPDRFAERSGEHWLRAVCAELWGLV